MGAFRGLGQQKIAAIISISSLLVISIPLGCLFAFRWNMNISGFWLGYAIRSALAVGIYWYMLHHNFDWEEIAKEAVEREEKQRLLRRSFAPPEDHLHATHMMGGRPS
jgi:Na+-driven multidrug efflux pump